ncbi:MAG: hypothetical protein AB2552_05660 [Candidatus Thiodiazotropha endolucinida]
MTMYPDNYLDHWGDLYVRNCALLKARGVLFETFLMAPRDILTAVAFNKPLPLAEGQAFYPLLPKQQAIQERLFNEEQNEFEKEWLEQMLTRIRQTGKSPMRVSNGQIIEPLTHSTHPPRRAHRYFRGGQCG